MIHFYYYLVLLNAVVCSAVGVTVFLKNRYVLVGPMLGIAMVVMAMWLGCFHSITVRCPRRTPLCGDT